MRLTLAKSGLSDKFSWNQRPEKTNTYGTNNVFTFGRNTVCFDEPSANVTNVHTMSYDLIVPRFHRFIFLHATSGLTRCFSVGYIPSTRITCWPGIAPTSALNVSSRMVSVGVHSRWQVEMWDVRMTLKNG